MDNRKSEQSDAGRSRRVDINRSGYELTAVKPDQYPAGNMPEIALVGRSNVGKSSFINSILNRKGLAKVSSEPGKTRGINFFNIDDTMYFVDLPGYGYAKVSKREKASWAEMIETYLNTRKQLKLVIMLVDIRHAPTDDDKLMYRWILDRGIGHMIIATKADKISRGQVQGRLSEIRKVLGIKPDASLTAYSSETGQGREQVWNELEKAVLEQTVNEQI
jgi:GTP-binding protein